MGVPSADFTRFNNFSDGGATGMGIGVPLGVNCSSVASSSLAGGSSAKISSLLSDHLDFGAGFALTGLFRGAFRALLLEDYTDSLRYTDHNTLATYRSEELAQVEFT